MCTRATHTAAAAVASLPRAHPGPLKMPARTVPCHRGVELACNAPRCIVRTAPPFNCTALNTANRRCASLAAQRVKVPKPGRHCAQQHSRTCGLATYHGPDLVAYRPQPYVAPGSHGAHAASSAIRLAHAARVAITHLAARRCRRQACHRNACARVAARLSACDAAHSDAAMNDMVGTALDPAGHACMHHARNPLPCAADARLVLLQQGHVAHVAHAREALVHRLERDLLCQRRRRRGAKQLAEVRPR